MNAEGAVPAVQAVPAVIPAAAARRGQRKKQRIKKGYFPGSFFIYVFHKKGEYAILRKCYEITFTFWAAES